MEFDPSISISADYGVFGLPFTENEAKLVLLPVPWEVTTSYGRGASLGPKIIRRASEQVDLFDLETGKAYEEGFFMRPINDELLQENNLTKAKAQELIELVTAQSSDDVRMEQLRAKVNLACEKMSQWVYEQSRAVLAAGKILGLVGGDHSTPLGAIRAISEKHLGKFGILHIDAHADLRKAYQGFAQSHASIMYNVMSSHFAPQKLVQVGIRDFCEEEFEFLRDPKNKIKTYFDLDCKRRLQSGDTWSKIAKEIVNDLPAKVYISFDIDGLDPALCPSTGTPVAGGLSINEAFHLFREVADSGREIIGFDLNEVSAGPNGDSEWDGNVGARVLYKLCGWSIKTQRRPL